MKFLLPASVMVVLFACVSGQVDDFEAQQQCFANFIADPDNSEAVLELQNDCPTEAFLDNVYNLLCGKVGFILVFLLDNFHRSV